MGLKRKIGSDNCAIRFLLGASQFFLSMYLNMVLVIGLHVYHASFAANGFRTRLLDHDVCFYYMFM